MSKTRAAGILLCLMLGAIFASQTVAPNQGTDAVTVPQTVKGGTDAIAVPHLINYQGKLTDALGVPLPDPAYDLTFSIWDASSAGNKLWEETQLAVPVTNGLFSVVLGTVTVNPVIPDNGVAWLQTAVGLTPIDQRVQLVTAPYAYSANNAHLLEGNAPSAFALASHDHTSSGGDVTGSANGILSIGSGKVTLSKISPTGATTGQTITYNGSSIVWATPSGDVTSVTASAPLNSTGGTTPNISLTGTVAVGNGGTGTGTAPTQYGVIYAASTSAYTSLAPGTSGYVLTSNGAAAPSWQAAAGGVSGSGTAGYVSRWTGSTALGNGSIQDGGSGYIGVGAAPNSYYGVYGYNAYYGVYGYNSSYTTSGALASYNGPSGVYGYSASYYGVYGYSSGSGYAGVYGYTGSGSGTSYRGVYGAGPYIGVMGIATSYSTWGVLGYGVSPYAGVYGYTSSGSGNSYCGVYGIGPYVGVLGFSSSYSAYGILGAYNNGYPAGVYGYGSSYYGVYGYSGGSGYAGTYGYNAGSYGYGVYGYANGNSSYTYQYGVAGYCPSSYYGTGVYGYASTYYSGYPSYGVYGYCANQYYGYAYGVYGSAYSTYQNNAPQAGGYFYNYVSSSIYSYPGYLYGVVGNVYTYYSNCNYTYAVYGYVSTSSSIYAGAYPTYAGFFLAQPYYNYGAVYGVYASAYPQANYTSGYYSYGVYAYAYNPAGYSYTYGMYAYNNGGYYCAIAYASFGYLTNGTKSCDITTSQGHRAMFCTEAPEVQFEDFGSSRLVAGRAHVALDPLLLEALVIDANHPLRVYVTATNGEAIALGVTKGTTSFDVVGPSGSNATFDWRITASRKGFEDKRLPSLEQAEAKQPPAPKPPEVVKPAPAAPTAPGPVAPAPNAPVQQNAPAPKGTVAPTSSPTDVNK